MSNLMMPSRVLLYGRVMQGIDIDVDVFDKGIGGLAGLGNNRFLREQFDASKKLNDSMRENLDPCFAMIYGFEFEAHYYDLMAPTIMLVHGPGTIPRDRSDLGRDLELAKTTDRVEDPFPIIAPDIVVWPYDKADYSMRLDPSSGPIESILLDAEFDDSEMMAETSGRHVSGRHVGGNLGRGRHVSGRHVGGRGRGSK